MDFIYNDHVASPCKVSPSHTLNVSWVSSTASAIFPCVLGAEVTGPHQAAHSSVPVHREPALGYALREGQRRHSLLPLKL